MMYCILVYYIIKFINHPEMSFYGVSVLISFQNFCGIRVETYDLPLPLQVCTERLILDAGVVRVLARESAAAPVSQANDEDD